MNPKDYKYTKDHEWIHVETDGTGKVGLADYAQSHLGDLVYLDLPTTGTQIEQGKKMGEIESVKAVSDFFSPTTGKVLEVNQACVDDPTIVNKDCYGEGWLLRVEIADPADLDNLTAIDAYEKLLAELAEE